VVIPHRNASSRTIYSPTNIPVRLIRDVLEIKRDLSVRLVYYQLSLRREISEVLSYFNWLRELAEKLNGMFDHYMHANQDCLRIKN
jgi:hypothetical protein